MHPDVMKKEMAEAAEHVTGGKLDLLSNETLLYFAQLTRGMAELAEAEIRRRGAFRLPVVRRGH